LHYYEQQSEIEQVANHSKIDFVDNLDILFCASLRSRRVKNWGGIMLAERADKERWPLPGSICMQAI
jgi:hypothetical protein